MSLSVDIIISKAEKCVKKNNFFEAKDLYNSILIKFPNNIRAQNGINKIKKIDNNYKNLFINLPDNIYNELIILNEQKLFNVILKNIEQLENEYKNSFELYNFKGVALYQLGKIDQAINCFVKSIKLNSNFHESFNNIANCYQTQNRTNEAIKNFKKSIDIKPSFFEGYYNLANCYKQTCQFNLAKTNYLKSIELNANNINAHYNLGNLYIIEKKHEESIKCFEEILKIDKDHNMSLSHKTHQELHIGKWSENNKVKLVENLMVYNKAAMPFEILSIIDDIKIQQKASILYAKNKFSQKLNNIISHDVARKTIIRIGYFSSDFYNHATMHLMIKLFQYHDQNHFQIFLYDYGTNKPDKMTERIKNQPVIYKKVSSLSDQEIISIVRQDHIDIAVDLKGYTGGGRPGLFCYKIAPIQASFLGYPGTLGFKEMDYIIGDSTVIPVGHDCYYNEKIVRLPNSYQINDNSRFVPEKKFSNSNLGLPNDCFIFCNFNNNYKINKVVFDIWIRLLKNTENSVLWLLESNSIIKNNLIDYASSKGISKNRIIFAPKMNINDHLSRHLNADLFLDTFTYNAHTTGSDALWCGIPIITKIGSSFPSRVGASLLKAVDLEKLITKTSDEYYQLAHFYSQNEVELQKIKDLLVKNRNKYTLFNSQLFSKNIERAYMLMIKNYLNKELKNINL